MCVPLPLARRLPLRNQHQTILRPLVARCPQCLTKEGGGHQWPRLIHQRNHLDKLKMIADVKIMGYM